VKLEKIHEDKRGEIYCFDINGKEFLLLSTKKGFSRGGEIHDRNQYLIVLEGEIEVMLYDVDNKTEGISHRYNPVGQGELVKIPIGTPHYMTALTDSLVLEWKGKKWDCKEAKEMARLYRKMVVEALK